MPDQGKDKQTLTVTVVLTERNLERHNVNLERNQKVGEAAKEVATAAPFNLPADGTYIFRWNDEDLNSNNPLAKYKIKDGDVLRIIDKGGGV